MKRLTMEEFIEKERRIQETERLRSEARIINRELQDYADEHGFETPSDYDMSAKAMYAQYCDFRMKIAEIEEQRAKNEWHRWYAEKQELI